MYYFRISDIHLADNSRQNILSKTENLLVHCKSSAVQFIFVLGLFCTFKFQKNSCTLALPLSFIILIILHLINFPFFVKTNVNTSFGQLLADFPGMALEFQNIQTFDNPGFGLLLLNCRVLSSPEDGENSVILR